MYSNNTSSNTPNIGRKGYYLYFQPTSTQQQQPPQQQQQASEQQQSPSTSTPSSTTTSKSQQRFQRSSSHFQSRISRYEKERLKLGNKKIVAVGFIGMHEQSIDIVNDILQKKIFSEQHRSNIKKEFSEFNLNSFPIDSYHDSESNTIYMYLDLYLDLPAVMAYVKKLRAQRKKDDKPMTFENELDFQLGEREYSVLKALIFMFHTCHITMFINPDKRFDLKFLRLFRILQLSKQSVNASLLSHLGSSVFTHDLKFSSLYSPGRVLPVVAFVFYQKRTEWNKIKSQVADSDDEKILDRMQQALESQVRSILKKGRFAGTDNTRTPLFMVDPTKCAFVLVEPEDVYGHKKFISDFTSTLFNLTEAENTAAVNLGTQKVFYARAIATPNKKPVYPQTIKSTVENVEKLRDFLDRQYEYFMKQMQTGKRYVLPSSFNWYHASFAFEEFMFMKNSASGKWKDRESSEEQRSDSTTLRIDAELDKIKPLLNPDWQFSQNRCTQAFALVKKQFCDEAASNNSNSKNKNNSNNTNKNKNVSELIETAIRTYDAYASGPYQEKYKQDLIEELTNFYKEQQDSSEAE